MNKFAHIVLSVVVVAGLAASPALLAQKKAEPSPAAAAAEGQSKMTAEQAKKAVLKKYPAANIVSCTASTMSGKAGWEVKFTSTGGNVAQKVFVDDAGTVTRL